MGADYEGQEKGIIVLRGMDEEGRKYISHHFRNSMNVVLGNLVLAQSDIMVAEQTDNTDIPGRLREAKKAADHLLSDLKKIGC